jgi:hypothetical protein
MLTITFGWWILPAIVTIIAFGIAYRKQVRARVSDLYGAASAINLGFYFFAAFASVLAWLVYFIVT